MRTSVGVCLARQMRGGKVTLHCGARGQMLFMELIMRRGSMKKINKKLYVNIRCNENMIMLCRSSDKIQLNFDIPCIYNIIISCKTVDSEW